MQYISQATALLAALTTGANTLFFWNYLIQEISMIQVISKNIVLAPVIKVRCIKVNLGLDGRANPPHKYMILHLTIAVNDDKSGVTCLKFMIMWFSCLPTWLTNPPLV